MKHLAIIQSEFLKEADYKRPAGWDTLSLDAQKEYLRQHPKSKRRLSAYPESKKTIDDADVKKLLDEYGSFTTQDGEMYHSLDSIKSLKEPLYLEGSNVQVTHDGHSIILAGPLDQVHRAYRKVNPIKPTENPTVAELHAARESAEGTKQSLWSISRKMQQVGRKPQYKAEYNRLRAGLDDLFDAYPILRQEYIKELTTD